MANLAFVSSLVVFHLVLFAGLWAYARGRPRLGNVLVALSGPFLAYVGYDLWRDPDPERLGGLFMGLTFMCALMWAGALVLYAHVAARGGEVTPALAWLTRRSFYWTTSGALGTLVFGALFPRLRGIEGLDGSRAVMWALAVGGSSLAALTVAVVLTGVRPSAKRMLDAGTSAPERERAARRAAWLTAMSLAAGFGAVALLTLSGMP